MKQRILAFALSLATIVSMVGCSTAPPEADPTLEGGKSKSGSLNKGEILEAPPPPPGARK